MAGLDYLFNAPPASVTGAVSSVTNVPDWMQEYERAMAGKATEVAGEGYQPYPGQQVAGFNNDQENAFQQVRDNQGSWEPGLGSALDSASGIAGAAQAGTAQAGQYAQGAVDSAQSGTGQAGQAAQGAVDSVAGPAANWTSNWQQYMSPYTQSVVDEIGRQGDLNLTQNILPGINSTFTGSGQFGSGRNAAAVGQGISQAQQGISGLQSQALQSGYGEAASIFGQDANREQQQQSMQAQTGLGAANIYDTGAQLNANTGLGAAGVANNSATINSGAMDTEAQRMGALTQMQQAMQNQDTAALGAVGGQEQGLQQAGDTASYNDFLTQRNWDWSNLANMNSIVHGLPMSMSNTATSSQDTYPVGQSPLTWLNGLYGVGGASNAANNTTQGG